MAYEQLESFGKQCFYFTNLQKFDIINSTKTDPKEKQPEYIK